MNRCVTVVAASLIVVLLPGVYPRAFGAGRECVCAVSGGVTVDSLFRAIPAGLIKMEKEHRKDAPVMLDRANGYLSVSYNDPSGNNIEYTAALYTGGPANKRIFLMVARKMNYIAQLPHTEGFWIFEYTPGKCRDMTDTMRPWNDDGGLVTLPRRGTDLERCVTAGDERGLREACITYSWDLAGARFVEKKAKK